MKLMLVDDHPLFMEGLQYLLNTYGIKVTGTAKNGREAVQKARMLKPDIILMDLKMPECDGLDALKLIKAETPEIKVVILTTSEEDEDLFDAMRFGASGYLLKNMNAQELVDMLAALENDEIPLSAGLATRLLLEFRNSNTGRLEQTKTAQSERQLTERQLEVLEMIARGITYKETGERLGLTERTVKYHMSRILERLHLENRAQVIAYAAQMGLIERQKPEDE
jgi:two-component system NarL family response regulator